VGGVGRGVLWFGGVGRGGRLQWLLSLLKEKKRLAKCYRYRTL